MADVVVELLGEHLERARDETGRAVGVAAGATPVDEPDEVRRSGTLRPAHRRGAAERELSNVVASASRPKTQGPHWRALCAASQRVTRAISATGQALGGEQHQDPGAERGAVGSELLVGEREPRRRPPTVASTQAPA